MYIFFRKGILLILLIPISTHLSISYSISKAHANDVKKVVEWYQHRPVPGYDIKSVEVVHNNQLSRVFSGEWIY